MILIVEDHTDTREALVKYLCDHELNTVGVRDGDEALRLMENVAPFLVILDWHMPIRNGLEVLCEMRKNNRLKILVLVKTQEKNYHHTTLLIDKLPIAISGV